MSNEPESGMTKELVDRAERAVMDAIEAQFDIHALEPEDFGEMWVAVSKAVKALAQGIEAATAAETVKQGSVHESPVGGNADAPKGESR